MNIADYLASYQGTPGSVMLYNDLKALAETGGADYVYSQGSTSTGSHTGTNTVNNYAQNGNPTILGYSTNIPVNAGSHSHTVSGLCKVANQQSLLIKATRNLNKFPAKGGILSTTGLSLTNIFTDPRILKSGDSVSSTADSDTIVTSESGSHMHGPSSGTSGYLSYPGTFHYYGGAHSHTLTTVMTPSVKRKILSAWSNASSEFDVETDMIAMWESATPPHGWSICDGNNGTVDLRNYFIGVDITGNEDVVGLGDNSMAVSVTITDSSWTHRHNTGYWIGTYGSNNYHGNESFLHGHTVSSQDSAYVPPYYALYFIQKL